MAEVGGEMIYAGDCLEILPTLEAESVQCCVTSPPYYGLRDYGTAAWEGGDPECNHIDEVAAAEQRRNRKGLANNADENDGATRSREVQNGIDKAFQYKTACPKCGATRIDSQIGLEPTPEAYVEKLVAVFREVRRVLRGDGTVFLNLGDSYASGKGTCYNPGGGSSSLGKERKEAGAHPLDRGNKSTLEASGLKPKDLVGIPWRVAFALQADGWWLRQDIIWAKPNPMPESVTDRPTRSHEYLFLLAKSQRYYYDAEAVKEACQSGPSDIKKMQESRDRIGGKHKDLIDPFSKASSATKIGQKRSVGHPAGRNCRSVWTIPTQPFPGAHFATFPEALVTPCIKAGTSEKGCCPKCFAPWVRKVNRVPATSTSRPKEQASHIARGGTGDHTGTVGKSGGGRIDGYSETLGWEPTCTHNLPSIPCTVLDPFSGAGTTGLVAEKLGRNFVGIELNPEYAKMAEKRIEAAEMPLFREDL